ncbi:nuclear envelope pore membrane protein POM 121-like [Chiroxiphia lanceolata]|uniref:nuclear envelope pore membrane protein POM 121-like n=1 Tax=Chiroxiphia lanceolata TaxID=296741 RepID=UPI0013CE52A2|nr:nuclear envelope pore membrane protein POM 121-like [Chiroxiphia lanceolata]
MAGAGPGGRDGAVRAALAVAAALALALACVLLRGALLGAAALGAAGAWCAMRPGPPASRPPTKAAANGGPAVRAAPRRAQPGALRCPPQPPRRRYPLPQPRPAAPLGLTTARWEGGSPRAAPWARRAGPLRSPVTVRIAPPAASITRAPALEQLVSPLAFPATSSPDPCAKETVLNAIRESRKRAVEEEEEEEQTFGNDQESKRRRHDSSGSGQSAFEPLVANGAPASLVPKPGSLKRGLVSHCPDDCSNKRSRTSSMSSLNNTYSGGIPSSIRNAITSSYSSTRGLAQLWKRSGVNLSPMSSPASSRPQTPEWPLKKAREEESHRSNTSTPVKSDKELQTEKVAESPVWKKNSLSPPSAPGSSGKRKRKIPLLSSIRGDQLVLPPPPQLGYSITSEDLDAEKKAMLQWFNSVLEDKADAVPSTTAEMTPVSKPLVFTVTSSGPAPASTAPTLASSSLLDSLKKMQSSQAAPTAPDTTGAAAASQPPPSTAQPPAPTVSLESSSLPDTSADTKPVPVLSTPAPPALGVQPPNSLAPSAFTELGQTSSKSPSLPKPSIVFGMLNTPPASQPAATVATAVPTTATAMPITATAVPTPATAVPTAATAIPTTMATAMPTPMFKPIFGAVPKSESTAVCTAVTSTTATVSASSGPSSTSSTTTTMFKPIFGSVTTASSPAKVSPFAFKPTAQPAPERPGASSPTPVFTGLPNIIFTTAATTATTQSSSTDATIKPVFSFGLTPPSSTGPTASPAVTVTAATSTSAAQPFLFGAPASSTPSTETNFATPGPVFQFGKPPLATVTATTTAPAGPAFGQAPSSSTTAATTTAGFSIFGSTTLTSSAPATTAQAPLTFGSTVSAFGSSFSTGAKPPPPYPGTGSAFSAGAADSQASTSKPAAGPVSFAPPFSFGAPLAQSAAQPAFGSGAQTAFGTTSAQGSFGTSSTQAAFGGTTTSVFSFGTATSTTSSFGATTQTTSSSAGGTVFGTTPSPFTFGATTQPGPSAGAFGMSTPGLSSGSPAMAFNFGAGQSGAAPAAAPFGSSLQQSTLGAPGQSTPFAFTMTSTPNSKPTFGGAPAPTFGQSTPVPGAVGSGSSTLSFRTPSTPASGFGGVGSSFGSSTPTFSIGAGSKTGARQRLQARRQHTRKK